MVGGGSADDNEDENAFESGGEGGEGDDPVHKLHLIAPPPPSGANCRLPGIDRSVAERRVDDGKYASSSFASRYEDFCWKGALSVAVAGKNESRSWALRYRGSCC